MSHVGPHAELFGGLHAAMPHQVCLMASDVVHFKKPPKLFMLCCRTVLKTWLRELVMLGSVVCCRLLTPSSCLSIFWKDADVKAAGCILDTQCKYKSLFQSESSRWKCLTQGTQYLYYLWATKPTYNFHGITFIYLQLKMAKFLEDDNVVIRFISKGR